MLHSTHLQLCYSYVIIILCLLLQHYTIANELYIRNRRRKLTTKRTFVLHCRNYSVHLLNVQTSKPRYFVIMKHETKVSLYFFGPTSFTTRRYVSLLHYMYIHAANMPIVYLTFIIAFKLPRQYTILLYI